MPSAHASSRPRSRCSIGQPQRVPHATSCEGLLLSLRSYVRAWSVRPRRPPFRAPHRLHIRAGSRASMGARGALGQPAGGRARCRQHRPTHRGRLDGRAGRRAAPAAPDHRASSGWEGVRASTVYRDGYHMSHHVRLFFGSPNVLPIQVSDANLISVQISATIDLQVYPQVPSRAQLSS